METKFNFKSQICTTRHSPNGKVYAELREFEEFKQLVRKMREAQRNYYKDRPKVGYKVAYQNMVNKEQLVDEYLKEMEG